MYYLRWNNISANVFKDKRALEWWHYEFIRDNFLFSRFGILIKFLTVFVFIKSLLSFQEEFFIHLMVLIAGEINLPIKLTELHTLSLQMMINFNKIKEDHK
jgi:hypothetical protein